MNTTSNWPNGTDLSHSNFTGKFPRVSRYEGQGGWAKDSATPPGGWTTAIIGTIAVIAVCAGVVFIGAAVGL